MKLNVYLNFMGNTEEAFTFYKQVFGGEFTSFQRFKDVPNLPNREKMKDEDMTKLMHVALKIGDNMLMGTDAIENMGHKVTVGNNISLSLHPDTKEEADKLFAALSAGGKSEMPLQDMFWGDYYGMLEDKFGIKWMINVSAKK